MADKKKTSNSSVAALLAGLGGADFTYGAGDKQPAPSTAPEAAPEPEPAAASSEDAPVRKAPREKKAEPKPASRLRKKSAANGDEDDDAGRSLVSLSREDYDVLTAAVYAFRIVTGKKLSYGKLINLLLNECLPKTHPKVYRRMRLILGGEEEE